MSTTKKTKHPTGRARLRAEIVEMAEAQHRHGLIGPDELAKTTMRMLGKDAVPKIERMSPNEIVKVREGAKVSQAVLAAFLNVAVMTVSQWERGTRQPSGPALKLLNVIRAHGIEPLR